MASFGLCQGQNYVGYGPYPSRTKLEENVLAFLATWEVHISSIVQRTESMLVVLSTVELKNFLTSFLSLRFQQYLVAIWSIFETSIRFHLFLLEKGNAG